MRKYSTSVGESFFIPSVYDVLTTSAEHTWYPRIPSDGRPARRDVCIRTLIDGRITFTFFLLDKFVDNRRRLLDVFLYEFLDMKTERNLTVKKRFIKFFRTSRRTPNGDVS